MFHRHIHDILRLLSFKIFIARGKNYIQYMNILYLSKMTFLKKEVKKRR